MTWFVQRATGCISKYQVGEDGKTSYEQLKGKPISRPAVEFGEKIHFKHSAKCQKEHKLDAKQNERHFLVFYCRNQGGCSEGGDNKKSWSTSPMGCRRARHNLWTSLET